MIINLFFSSDHIFIQKFFSKAEIKVENEVQKTNINKTEEPLEVLEASKEISNSQESDIGWYLEIPSISLKADIQEGTTKEIMNQFIGHFEETSKELGNIGLAAHNRGYEKNYFENLKKLKEGDIIYYQYQNNKRIYEVTKCCIIKDTDWSYLEQTEENTITLITCVENQPEYRRCVQGKEKRKESEDSKFEKQ